MLHMYIPIAYSPDMSVVCSKILEYVSLGLHAWSVKW